MRLKLLVVYILIVAAPLAAAAWLGITLAGQEAALVEMRFRDVLSGRLNDVNLRIMELLDQRERQLMAGVPLGTLTPVELRERTRSSGIVRQYFVLDSQMDLAYPNPNGPRTEAEEQFLRRTETIWRHREIPGPEPEELPGTAAGAYARMVQGWHAGYLESGIRLLFWWREDGQIVGAELNEVRLISDIVGLLPEAWPGMPPEQSPLPDGRIELVDAQGATVYHWGGYAPGEGQKARVRLALSPPLNAWSLRYFAPDGAVGAVHGPGTLFNVLSGIAVLALALVALAVYFYREHTRVVREALQRVSFVNQVSHELKTPLTNIRLYAEVLGEEVGDADPAFQRRLNVIVSESQRLSRLINNVLTFGRGQRSTLTLRRTPGRIEDALRSVVAQYEEAFEARGIHAVLEVNAPQTASFDRDAVEQIMGNLLSNVEKYAVDGTVDITLCQEGDTASITVADEGPGVPQEQCKRIFEAFCRAENRLTEGVSGVGLGLTIARQLARLHGGDLTIEQSETGARFRATLHAPVCETGESV